MSRFDRYTTTEYAEALRSFLTLSKRHYLREAGLIDTQTKPRPGRPRRYKDEGITLLEELVNEKGARCEAPDSTIGERLRIARDYIGLSDRDLADYMGVSRELARRWRADIHRPSAMDKLAKLLDVPHKWLEEGGEDNLPANSHLGVRVGEEAKFWRVQLFNMTLAILDDIPEEIDDAEYIQAYVEWAVYNRPAMAQAARRAAGRWHLMAGVQEPLFVPWVSIPPRDSGRRRWSDEVEAIIDEELVHQHSVYAAWAAVKARCAAKGLREDEYPKRISLHKRVEKAKADIEKFGVDLNAQVAASVEKCSSHEKDDDFVRKRLAAPDDGGKQSNEAAVKLATVERERRGNHHAAQANAQSRDDTTVETGDRSMTPGRNGKGKKFQHIGTDINYFEAARALAVSHTPDASPHLPKTPSMLSQIVDASQLQSSAETLRAALRNHAYREQKVVWGTPSGRRDEFETFVLRARSHDIYVGIGDGIARPGTYSHLFRLVEHHAEPTPAFSPEAEVNVSMTGGQAVGGLFAKEGERLFLCRWPTFTIYRGRIKEKDALDFLGDHAVPIQAGKRLRKVLPVVALDSPTFVDDLEDFIQRVISVRNYFRMDVDAANATGLTRTANPSDMWPWNDSAEFEGTKSLDARAPVSYEYLHGPLCNRFSAALRAWARERFDVRSTKNIDSALVGKGGIARAIFEVKTSGSLSDQLYKAVGQLQHYRWKRGDENTLLGVVLPGAVKGEAGHASIFLGAQRIHVFYETAPNRYALDDSTALEVVLDKHLL